MSTSAATPKGSPVGLRLAGRDARRSVRVPHVVEAWICSPTAVEPDDEREEVRSVNISRHGVCFAIGRDLPTGAFWIIELTFGEQLLISEVRIINCRKMEDGSFEVGAEFC